MTNEELKDAFWKMQFGLRRSYFYHERRVLFWRTVLFVAQGMEAALGSTAAAFLFNENGSSLTKWLVLASAIISFVVVWFDASKRIQVNMTKKARFADLEDRIPFNEDKYSEALLEEIRQVRRKIEKDDDVVLPCVDVLARNDACRALGVPEDRKLSFVERTIGRLLPIPYDKKVA